jgi:CheY-like chemotaxis protein
VNAGNREILLIARAYLEHPYMDYRIAGCTTIFVAHQEVSNVTTAEVSGHSGLNRPKTILIADDSELVRTKLRRALERDTEFAVCGEATDGVEAVAKAKELTPDLILLDVKMPRLTGLEVAGILRSTQPRIRIMMVTMYAEELNKTLTSLFGVDAVFSKSEGVTKLIERVENLLAA